MTSESRFAVFLDADVLASPMTRTLLMAIAFEPGARFTLRWCLSVEKEADKASRPHQTRVSDLRQRFDWGTNVLIPDATPEQMAQLVDTSETDKHVLAAACSAGIRILITRNVRDFGRNDLATGRISAVHPDTFLAVMVTPQLYQGALEMMAASRSREPNTPQTLHAALGTGHPQLFEAMREIYPNVEPIPDVHKSPAETFRGNRCIVCGKPLSDPNTLAFGIGPECRKR